MVASARADPMSNLAELLQSRGLMAATPATAAKPECIGSGRSKSSGVAQSELNFAAELDRRVRAMAGRWSYPADLLSDWLADGRRDPAKILAAVAMDERRFGLSSEPVQWPPKESQRWLT
jgi:hypothetical protein